MPTADKVIIELEARVSKAEADIRRYKSTTESSLKAVEQASARAAKKQEAEFKRAARAIKAEQSQIGASMKALGASIGAYFGASEIIKLADGFTRVQNALKVAGLEGAALKGVQDQLLGQSQKYGVGLESLANLYGKASQSAKELGASSQDLINLTEYTSQALKISGTRAENAGGAILGLNQALSSGRISIEEYNQMLEGGLLPLLQAAANNEKFGGSVNKLRQYMIDTGMSGAEFFRLINAGASELETKSNKAVLTLSGGFVALTSSIMVYIGEADAANGVSAALGAAMAEVGENLDVLADAIAAISVALGVRFVAGAVAGSGALRALTAAAAGSTTALGATAAAGRAAGAALLAAMGGPVGAIITATAMAIGYLATRETEAESTAKRLAAATELASDGRKKAISLSQRYAAALGAERAEVVKLINVEIGLAKTRQAAAKSEVARALAKVKYDKEQLAVARRVASKGGGPHGAGGLMIGQTLEDATSSTAASVKNLQAATANLEQETGALAELANAFKGQGPIKSGGGAASPATDKKDKAKKGPKTPKDTGPSPEDIAADHASDLRRLRAEELQAQIQLTDDIREKADLQKQLDELEYKDRLAQIDQNKEYTRAQKDAQIKALQRIFGTGGEGTDQEGLRRSIALKELDKEIERQQTELAQAIAESLEAELALEIEGLDSRKEQLEVEGQILDARHKAAMIAIENSDLDEEIKQQKRAQLEAETALAKKRIEKEGQSPLEKYIEESRKIKANLDDEIGNIAVDGLDALNEGLVDAIMGAKSLGEVFSNVAKQIIADLLRIAIRMAIFNVLGNIGGINFGGGSMNAVTGTPYIPGNASGGSFRVKGQGGTDKNVLSLNGQPVRRVSMGETVSINPSGRGGNSGGSQSIYVDARGAVMNDQFAQMILKQSKQYAAQAGQASYAQSMRDAPGAVGAKQRYG